MVYLDGPYPEKWKRKGTSARGGNGNDRSQKYMSKENAIYFTSVCLPAVVVFKELK